MATKLEDAWNELGFVENLYLAAQEVRFIFARTARCFYHSILEAYSRIFEQAKSRIFRLCSTTLSGQSKAIQKTCLHTAKEAAAFATQFKPGHWFFLRLASENTWWNGNSNETGGKMSQCTWLTHSSVILPTRYFQLGQLRKGVRYCHFQGTFEKKKIRIKTILARNLRCIYNRICPRNETENQHLHREQRKMKSNIDLEPEQLTLITQKQQTMPQARGDSLLQLTENLESLIRRVSERDGKQFHFFYAENAKNQQNLTVRDLQPVLTDHVKIEPVTGIEVFKSRRPGHSKSCVRKSPGVELKPHHHSSQFAAGDRERRKLADSCQSDFKLRGSQSFCHLVSVNEFGN